MNTDILETLKSQFTAQVPEDKRDALNRVVTAGQRILYSKETHPMVDEFLTKDGDPAKAAGEGVVQLMGMLAQNSRGTMPKEVAAPAMMILLADSLDYLRQTGRIKGDAEDLDKATHSLSDTIMKASGVTNDAFEQVLGKAQESMSDPTVAAKMKEAGYGA